MKKLLFLSIIIATIFLNITPTYADVPKDINRGSNYAKESITILYNQNIISGDNNKNYNPRKNITRGEAITLLVKALDLETSNLPSTETFKDVPKNHWAFKYVETAYNKDIVKGISKDEFDVDGLCNREQIATLFVRALGLKKENIINKQENFYINDFKDRNLISYWAEDYLEFAVYTRLLQGVTDDLLNPKGYATKEQLAVLIDRYIKNYKDINEVAYLYEVGTTPNVTNISFGNYFSISFSDDFSGASIKKLTDSQGNRIIGISMNNRRYHRSGQPEDKSSFYFNHYNLNKGENYNLEITYTFKTKYGKKRLVTKKKVLIPKESKLYPLSISPRGNSKITVFFPNISHNYDKSLTDLDNYTITNELGNELQIENIDFSNGYNYATIHLKRPIFKKSKLNVNVKNINTHRLPDQKEHNVTIEPYTAEIIMGDKSTFIKDYSFNKYNNDITQEKDLLKSLKNKDIRFIINGDKIPLDNDILLENNEILVPLKLLKAMNIDSYYNSNTDVINIGRGSSPPNNSYKNALLKMGKNFCFINHNGYVNPFNNVEANKEKLSKLKAAPKKVNETIYLPLGFISKMVGSSIYIDSDSATLYLRESGRDLPMFYKAIKNDHIHGRKGQFNLYTEINKYENNKKKTYESISMTGLINRTNTKFRSNYKKESENENFNINRDIISLDKNVFEKDKEIKAYKILQGEGRKELKLLYNIGLLKLKKYDESGNGTKLTELIYKYYDKLPIKRIKEVKVNGENATKYSLNIDSRIKYNTDSDFSTFLRNHRFSDDEFNILNYDIPYKVDIYINDKQQIVKEVIKAKKIFNTHKEFIFTITLSDIDKDIKIEKPITFDNIKPNKVISFRDDNFKNHLQNIMDKETITEGDMLSLTELDLKFKEIDDLKNIEYAKNLETLDIGFNYNLSNVSLIANLKKLTHLDMKSINYNTNTWDLSFISELKNLKHIDLLNNSIYDIKPLATINLESLVLSKNNENIKDLIKLKSIKFLKIEDVTQKDLNIIGNLTNLETLILSRESVNPTTSLDITPLKNLTNLKKLDLNDNRIESIKPLEDMIKLEELSMNRNIINDLTPLKNMKKLRVLDLSFNRIKNLTPLKGLTNLEELNLDYNRIEDDTPIKDLPNLKSIRLLENPITR
ncbi:MAG: hypothetical protein FH751_02420 [Firmicutes bacterium]|nr:hypothetical protein [Bacillota bacterium]